MGEERGGVEEERGGVGAKRGAVGEERGGVGWDNMPGELQAPTSYPNQSRRF